MKRLIKFGGLSVIAISLAYTVLSKSANQSEGVQDGDIILQTSMSGQSPMVGLATFSKFTHVGIIFWEHGKPYVFEAVGPVKKTELSQFIDRGLFNSYRIMRCTKRPSRSQVKKMISWTSSQLGKRYDIQFRWSNDRMYCSELVWKAYSSAGIELCEPKKFSDFNLDNPLVKQAIAKRWGGKLDMTEQVVAPSDISESSKLYIVK